MATSTEIMNHFEKFLDAAQLEPVIIEKNGREMAVLMSITTYREFERLEDEVMQCRLKDSLQNAKDGRVTAADAVHDDLMSS